MMITLKSFSGYQVCILKYTLLLVIRDIFRASFRRIFFSILEQKSSHSYYKISGS